MKYFEKKQEVIKLMEALEGDLISSLIAKPKEIVRASLIINEDDFSQQRYRDAYKAIMEAITSDRDLISVLKEKKLKLNDLMKDYEIRSVRHLAQELRNLSKINKSIDLLQTSINQLDVKGDFDSYVANLQNEIIKINRLSKRKNSDIEHLIKDFDSQREIYANKTSLIGIPTGFGKLDEAIDGIRPEHLWIIGGYTSTGKTNFSLNLLKSIIRDGKRAVYYSLEMSEFDIISRMLAILSGNKIIDIIKKKDLDILEARQEIIQSRLSIITELSDLAKIKMSMIEENMKDKVDVFFVDFLQLVRSTKSENEYETMRMVAHELQEVSKQMHIPIIALSQINNEAAKSADSRIMGYKGAGDIAAAADLAIELNSAEDSYEEFRNKMNRGEKVKVNCFMKKNRHGRVGSFLCMFQGDTGTFEQLGYSETPRSKVDTVKRDLKKIKKTMSEIEEENNKSIFDNLK